MGFNAAYGKFNCHENDHGVWQRDIDEVEHFYTSVKKLYEASGRMFFAITGHVSLSLSVSDGDQHEDAEQRFQDAVRRAWLGLRYQQPAIASQVVYDADSCLWKKLYKTFRDQEDVNNWLETTCRVVSAEQTGDEWANSDPPAPSLPTIFIAKPSHSSTVDTKRIRLDLILRSPHDIIDGIGTLHLFNILVTLAARAYRQGEWWQPPIWDGSEVARLSPPYRLAAAVPPDPTPSQQRRLDEMRSSAASGPDPNEPETIAIPYGHGALLPGKHQRVAYEMSVEQTARVLSACKSVGATVTHVFHAAIAICMRDLQERRDQARLVRYVNYILRNERGHCTEPYNTADYAVGVYHSVSSGRMAVEMTVPGLRDAGPDMNERKKEFLGIVATIRDYYHNVRDDAEHYALAPYILAAGTPHVTPTSMCPVPLPKEYPSVSISSMGNIDNIINAKDEMFEVANPWVTGEELGNGLGLFLGTFKGCLGLSAAYNDAWHDKQEVMSFLKACVSSVLQGLGITQA